MALFVQSAYAQLTISNGEHTVEISGFISTYYNSRVLKPGNVNEKNDRFQLRDAQIQLEGRIGKKWEYELQYDFADASYSGPGFDAENPGLMEASVTYKGLEFVDVQAGYGKLYYGHSSLVPFKFSPYWSRTEITNGNLETNRDVGITLKKDFWNEKINFYGGVYSGLGEMSIRNGDNDASGKLEYVGRIDASYPTKMKYRDIDEDVTPIPMVQIGFGARYANKVLPKGEIFPTGVLGDFNLKAVNGKRTGIEFDLTAMYKGFSFQYEIHKIKAQPINETDPLFQGYSLEQTGGYVNAGGFFAQLNYNFKKAHTIASFRYEEADLNDLVPGKSKRLSGALAYKLGHNAMLKGQYYHILKEESIDPFKWKNQYRLGFQIGF